VVVDLKDHYAGRQHELSLLFPEPLVIVDPVDKGRNVASAVQLDKLYNFVATSRAFSENPDAAFFFPPKTQALPLEQLKSGLESRGVCIVFLVVDQEPAVPDVLWGQLYKTKRSLHKLMELSDYKILKDSVWSNEKDLSIFIFELEQQFLPTIKKHLGPPLEREPECESFLKKYAVNKQVISGPFLKDGRWVILLPRKITDVVVLLKDRLAGGGKNAGVADLIAESIHKRLRILINVEISEVYSGNGDFAVFLTEFLHSKPFWLKDQ
jgi:tRNA nucleotidyltransferase (CCA-adding enzyme)